MTTPSGWQIQQVMSIATATRARLEADGVWDEDAAALFAECPDAETMLVRVLRAMDEAAANGDAVSGRIKDLEMRWARYKRQRDELRSAAFAMMEALGTDKFRSAEFTVSITPGRAGVVILDEALIPDQFVKVTRTVDKTAVGAALAGGHDVPGATRANGAPVFTVRTK